MARRSTRVLAVTSRLSDMVRVSPIGRTRPLVIHQAAAKSRIDLSGVINPELGLDDDWDRGVFSDSCEAAAQIDDELADAPKFGRMNLEMHSSQHVQHRPDHIRGRWHKPMKKNRRRGFRQRRAFQRALKKYNLEVRQGDGLDPLDRAMLFLELSSQEEG